MGRYYDGDINGKFWFAIQPSNVGDRFNQYESNANITTYSIDREEYDDIKDTLRKIKANANYEVITEFFNDNNGYNDKTLNDAGITKEQLSEYADYEFGKKIIDFFDNNPHRDILTYDAEH